jgi:hypothetical protein
VGCNKPTDRLEEEAVEAGRNRGDGTHLVWQHRIDAGASRRELTPTEALTEGRSLKNPMEGARQRAGRLREASPLRRLSARGERRELRLVSHDREA